MYLGSLNKKYTNAKSIHTTCQLPVHRPSFPFQISTNREIWWQFRLHIPRPWQICFEVPHLPTHKQSFLFRVVFVVLFHRSSAQECQGLGSSFTRGLYCTSLSSCGIGTSCRWCWRFTLKKRERETLCYFLLLGKQLYAPRFIYSRPVPPQQWRIRKAGTFLEALVFVYALDNAVFITVCLLGPYYNECTEFWMLNIFL